MQFVNKNKDMYIILIYLYERGVMIYYYSLVMLNCFNMFI